jgi:hypothetical protein
LTWWNIEISAKVSSGSLSSAGGVKKSPLASGAAIWSRSQEWIMIGRPGIDTRLCLSMQESDFTRSFSSVTFPAPTGSTTGMTLGDFTGLLGKTLAALSDSTAL